MKLDRGSAKTVAGPHFASATFHVARVGDTFLDVSALGKGAVWVNGHALGRYWNEGPQKTLYLPGPWLHAGENRIVILDIFDAETKPQMLQGRMEPILNAPVPVAAAAVGK